MLDGPEMPDFIEGFIYEDKTGVYDDNKYVRIGEIRHLLDDGICYIVVTTSYAYRLFKSEEDYDPPINGAKVIP